MDTEKNIIAIIWDFDRTLTPIYMEDPLFKHYKVDPIKFWDEVNHLPGIYKNQGVNHISKDTLYLNHILTYVRKGIFKNLSNDLLKEIGKKVDFYKGLPSFFENIKNIVAVNSLYSMHNISVENYVVSTGIKEIILGSKIAKYLDGIWANEFIEDIALPNYLDKKLKIQKTKTLQQVAYILDNTSKTRALFEINKGVNKLSDLDVNAFLDSSKRRVPFSQMIYIADGPSDIPCFSIVNEREGKTFAVYEPQSELAFMQAHRLYQENRVQLFGEADYSKGSYTEMAITTLVLDIANSIVTRANPSMLPKKKSVPLHIVNGKFVHNE